MNELHEKYSKKGLIIIGVCSSKNGQEKMKETVEATGMKYPVARDATLKSGEKWSVMWYPTYAVVDRKGVLRALGLFHDEGMETIIKKLLDEEPPADDEAGDNPADGDQAAGEGAEEATAEIPADFREGREDRSPVDALEGAAPPPLTVSGWINSEPLDLKNLKGKVVLLDYWATW